MTQTIAAKCLNCEAIIRFDEKDVDGNRAIYGPPEFCPYCGKRSLE